MAEHLFTYGTLRPSLYPEQAKRFSLTPVKDGAIKGFTMWNLGSFPALVPVLDPKDMGLIVGEVVSVPDLTKIDFYEGYSVDGEGLYDRKEVVVNLAGAGAFMTKAWVYFMKRTPDLKRIRIIPSGDWFDVIRPRC